METALWIIGFGIIGCIIMLIWEVTDIQTSKKMKKLRKYYERQDEKEKELIEKIRTIAHEEAVKDSIVVQRLLGNLYTSEDGEFAISLMHKTMKWNDK